MRDTFLARLGRALDVFSAAAAASSAVESGRRPTAHDLALLGIDEKAFRKVRL